MSSHGTGNHASSDAASFLSLTIPTHLPTLTTQDGSASSLLPKAQLTIAPQLSGWTDIPPERQGVDFGQTDYFKYILNDNDVLTDVFLAVRLDGLNPGAGGANPRYPDDPLAHAIERITFQFGKDLQIIDGDSLHFNFMMTQDHDELGRLGHLRGYEVPVGKRIKDAESPKWYYLRLPFWWTLRDCDSWHQHCLQRLTRIMIQWRPINQILQQEVTNTQPTPKGGGQYILDHFLRFRVTAISENTKVEFRRRVESEGPAGMLYLIEDTQRLTQQLNAGNTQHVIQLNTFTKYGYNLRFIVRPVSCLSPNYLDNDRWQLMDILTCGLDISGKRYLQPTDDFWLTHAVDEKLFKGNPEHSIYNVPFSNFPDMIASAVGGIDFSVASNAQLTLTTIPLPEDYMVDFYLQCYNYVRLTIIGNNVGAELVQNL